MARILDLAPPTVDSGDRPGPDVPMGQWPAELYLAIEGVEYTAPVWDASPPEEWDDATDAPTWDELGGEVSEYVDAICWLHGLTINTGEPDWSTRYTAASLTATLDNRDGTWSRYGPTGALRFFPPGRKVHAWAVLDGAPWWLFSGSIATWQEVGDMVELEAFDAFTSLNARLNEWHVGAAGDTPKARMEAILAMVGWAGHTFKVDVGDITLVDHPTDNSPLEELQLIAESDAGVVLIDADGAFAFGDRRWIRGRDDQPRPPRVLSGNVCGEDVDAVLWELVLRTDDQHLANLVTLTNADTVPLTVTARNTFSEGQYGTFTLPENRRDDLWQTAVQGQAVAEYLVDLRDEPTARISSASLYLHDPRHDLWRLGIDLRRGDMVRFVHDTPAPGDTTRRLDLDLIVSAIRHDITPDGWVVTIGTTPTVGSRYVGNWDETPFTWDHADALNVWSH